MSQIQNLYTVAGHLKTATPLVRGIYERLFVSVQQFGPVHEAPKKTCIHLDRKSAFAGVYLRKDCINLTIKSDYEITSPRVTAGEQVSKKRFHQTIKLSSQSAIDKELLQWLKNAYLLSG